MSALEPCCRCHRHVRRGSRCPFCAPVVARVALAVALVVTPTLAHADAGSSDAESDATPDATDADATPDYHDDEGRHVVPLYGVPPDRSRGCGGCGRPAGGTTTGA